MDHNSSDTSLVVKLVSVWTTVAIGWSNVDWARLASTAAFLVSCIFIGEWLWKRIFRPFAERQGLVKRRLRRSTDTRPADFDPLEKVNRIGRAGD